MFDDNKDTLGIHLLDMFFDEELNDVSEELRKRYMRDPVHPTLVGYKEWWLPRFKDLCDKI